MLKPRNYCGILFTRTTVDGYYIQNDEVDAYVMIQAPSKKEFERIAERVTSEHSEYCECCGERWSIYYVDEGTEVPSIYETPVYVYDKRSAYCKDGAAILHHYDGKVERVKFT